MLQTNTGKRIRTIRISLLEQPLNDTVAQLRNFFTEEAGNFAVALVTLPSSRVIRVTPHPYDGLDPYWIGFFKLLLETGQEIPARAPASGPLPLQLLQPAA